MNLNCYRYVIAIAENLSISKAANELFITQPALTKYLNKLEQELGVSLFDRTVTPLQITYAGEVYVREGRKILEMQKFLEQELDEISQMQRGRLTIGINSERGSWCMPLLIPAFQERYPKVELVIQEGHSKFLEDELLKNHIDLFIGTLPLSSSELTYEYLSDEPIVLAIPADHRIARSYDLSENSPQTPYYLSPERLNGEPFILLVREQGMGRIARKLLKKHNIEPQIVMTLKNNNGALRMASSGLGITFAVADAAKRTQLIRPLSYFTFEDPVFCRKSVACYKKSTGLSPLAANFVKFWKELMVTESSLKGTDCQVLHKQPQI